jgi:hypothetical protein
MSATPEVFGSWETLTDGNAHYVLNGKCLCGAKVTKSSGPPQRKPQTGAGDSGAYVTPLCEECKSINDARWSGKKASKGGPAALRPASWHWWRNPKRRKR